MFTPSKNAPTQLRPPPEDHYVLYGWTQSYFTRKLDAALRFYGASFELKAKDASNAEELRVRSGTHQIPVLHTPENWMLADTTPIMRMLDGRYPARAMYPDGALGVLVHLLEEYFDEWIARTAVHWRWHYPENHELLSMGAVGGDRAAAAQLVQWGLRACRATGVTSDVQKAEAEKEYLRIMQAAEAQLAQTPFLLGTRPTAVDCIVLGGLRAHFDFDPAPRGVIHDAYPRVIAWSEAGANAWDGQGDVLAFPETTAFGEAILVELVRCYVPFALGNRAALAAGNKAFVAEVYGEEVSYLTRPYVERSRQMIVRRIGALPPAEQGRVAAWLDRWELRTVFE